MADNKTIIDGAGASFAGAADELSDSSFSPKVSILRGDQSPTPINPAEAIADDAAFTPGTSRVTPAGFTFDDVAPDSVNEGDIGAARMSANRNVYTTLRDAAGNERGLNVDATGNIGVTGNGTVITSAPTVSASPDYSDGDVLGALMTLTSAMRFSGGSGVLLSAVMTCKVDIVAGVTVDVLIFDSNPSNSTFTDNAAVAVDTADLGKLLGVIHLADRVDLGTPVVLQALAAGLGVKASGSANLYAVAVVRGGTGINLASTSDVSFRFDFSQD